MKILIAFLITIFCGIGAYSQNTPRTRVVGNGDSQILISDSARYEIIKFSSYQLIVRLDRYTGKTYHYNYNTGRRRWTLIEVSGGLPNESASTTPKYEIYDQGSDVFLINNETGQTWLYYSSNLSWIPVAD